MKWLIKTYMLLLIMKPFRVGITLLILLACIGQTNGQKVRRIAESARVSDKRDRLKLESDQMVKIMALKRGKRNLSKVLSPNSCGNLAITPAELANMETTSSFIVNYSGFTAKAQTAFQYAVDIWSKIITADIPIEINASFTPLGPDVLGAAGPEFIFKDFSNAPLASTWYPEALAQQYAGMDLSGADISATFSSVFSNWYYGLDGCPGADEFDFVTVVMHEIGHGLGFFGSATPEFFGSPIFDFLGCFGFTADNFNLHPTIFDLFVEDGTGLRFRDIDPDFCYDAVLDAITGDDLFFSGDSINACYGQPIPLYAPSTWESGSSFSHFDETTFTGVQEHALMTPFISPGEAIHEPGCSRALLADLGFATHDFIPLPPRQAAIPTLDQWAIFLLGLNLLIFGVNFLRVRGVSMS